MSLKMNQVKNVIKSYNLYTIITLTNLNECLIT